MHKLMCVCNHCVRVRARRYHAECLDLKPHELQQYEDDSNTFICSDCVAHQAAGGQVHVHAYQQAQAQAYKKGNYVTGSWNA